MQCVSVCGVFESTSQHESSEDMERLMSSES